MADATREQIIDIINAVSREWDGCEYEAPGGAIDIGDAMRVAGYRRVHTLFDRASIGDTPAPQSTEGSPLVSGDSEANKEKGNG